MIKKIIISKFILGVSFLFILNVCVGQKSLYKTIYFPPNSFKINKKYLFDLKQIGNRLVSDTTSFLKIFGYSDTKGKKKYNENLSKKRTEKVYKYLVKHYKFDTSKIYITWLGEETDGAYDLHFPSAHVQQRCVDILINL